MTEPTSTDGAIRFYFASGNPWVVPTVAEDRRFIVIDFRDSTPPVELPAQCYDCINSTGRDHVCLDGHPQISPCPHHEPLPY